MATTVLRHAQPLTEVIYSNVEEVVAQGQYTFDTLWKNAIPARKKILEIEEGIIPIKTKVLDNPEEIAKKLRQITLESDYLNIYSTPTGMALGRDQYESINENINKKFPDSFVKWITSINDRKDIEIIEHFLKEGIKIKHNPNISSMNFVISDKYFASTTEKVNGAQMISNFLISNTPYTSNIFLLYLKMRGSRLGKRMREC
jgi:hypothetical protein